MDNVRIENKTHQGVFTIGKVYEVLAFRFPYVWACDDVGKNEPVHISEFEFVQGELC